MTAPWDCEAYGAEGAEVGALCFFAEAHERLCGSAAECAGRMIVERQRVFDRIGELAAEGDPTGAFLAGEFTDPAQVLGGGDVPCPANPGGECSTEVRALDAANDEAWRDALGEHEHTDGEAGAR